MQTKDSRRFGEKAHCNVAWAATGIATIAPLEANGTTLARW